RGHTGRKHGPLNRGMGTAPWDAVSCWDGRIRGWRLAARHTPPSSRPRGVKMNLIPDPAPDRMPTSTSAFRPVIESLLDTDLYKFTMWQAMLHRHPAAQAEYHFICRDRPQYPLAALAGQVQAQIDHLCGLRYTEDELRYL